jgi:hypothetical protein
MGLLCQLSGNSIPKSSRNHVPARIVTPKEPLGCGIVRQIFLLAGGRQSCLPNPKAVTRQKQTGLSVPPFASSSKNSMPPAILFAPLYTNSTTSILSRSLRGGHENHKRSPHGISEHIIETGYAVRQGWQEFARL